MEDQEQDEKMEEDAQEGVDITTSEIIRIKQEVQSAEEEEEAPEPNEPGKMRAIIYMRRISLRYFS